MSERPKISLTSQRSTPFLPWNGQVYPAGTHCTKPICISFPSPLIQPHPPPSSLPYSLPSTPTHSLPNASRLNHLPHAYPLTTNRLGRSNRPGQALQGRPSSANHRHPSAASMPSIYSSPTSRLRIRVPLRLPGSHDTRVGNGYAKARCYLGLYWALSNTC
jgi:hypothetical protein